MSDESSAVDSLGLWLRGQREAAGLSQQEVAERSGMSVRAISNLERDRTRKPYPRSIRLITDALGLADRGDELITRYRINRCAASRASQEACETAEPSLRSGGDKHDLSGSASTLVPRQLPPGTGHFTGRRKELALLTGLLDRAGGMPGAVVISAIDGTAGVGKTALALHWAHLAASRFPGGQLYLDMRGFAPSAQPMAAAEAVRTMLEALEIPAERIPASLDAQVALYRSLLSGKRMLIVLDNARNAGQVRPLLPGSPHCVVLITSRNQLTGLITAEGAQQLTLNSLTLTEAREFLMARLGPARLNARPAAVAELIALCVRLPLALAVVAAHASARPRLLLSELADELRDVHRCLDALETDDASADIRAVFSWSVDSLPVTTARMFRLLGMHPADGITVPAAASLAGVPPRQAQRMLKQLARAHLVIEQIPGRFAMHDLLHAYAAEQAEDEELAKECLTAVRRMLDHYLRTAHAAALILEPHRDPIPIPPPLPGAEPEIIADDQQAMAWFGSESRTLTALIDVALSQGFDSYAWQLPAVLATFFERRCAWDEYAVTQRIALAAAQRAGNKVGQATAHNYLGYIHTELGSYDKVRWHFEQAQALFRQLNMRTGEARAHLVIGMALDRQGKDHEALAHADRAFELYRAECHLGGQAVALNACGWAQCQLRHYEQALTSLQHALELHRALGHRPGEAATWDSLGYTHNRLHHHAKACVCYARAITLYSELEDLWNQADSLMHLGQAKRAANDSPAALDAWQQALEILHPLQDPAADRLRAEIKEAQQSMANR